MQFHMTGGSLMIDLAKLGPSPSRDDPGHVLPVPLPREFRRFDTELPGSGAGGHGKLGVMALEFQRQGDRTVRSGYYYRPPLQMFQPIYLDPHRRDMPFNMLLQNGGGMIQGDRYRIDIRCGPGAAAHVTTQSHGKLYKCEDNFITQMVDITADADSFIEYLPDTTIPYRDSRFFQCVQLRIEPSATAIIGDILAPGRTAHNGEHHHYTIYHSQLEAFDLDENLLAVDTIRLEPGSHSPKSPAILGAMDAVGVLHVFTQKLPADSLVTSLRAALNEHESTVCGVSTLPNGAGASVRILGSTAYLVERARTIAWDAARRAIFGVPAPNLRKA
jgi:urease accessory protein